MDNALLALYVWFTLALFVIVAVAPLSSSAVAMALWSALSLALSAHIAWRRLHWVPVEGELVGVYKYPGTRPVACVRYEFCGRVYESQDSIPLGLGRHGTVWVDPAHPSRILPPSWRGRLLIYLLFGAIPVYMLLESL